MLYELIYDFYVQKLRVDQMKSNSQLSVLHGILVLSPAVRPHPMSSSYYLHKTHDEWNNNEKNKLKTMINMIITQMDDQEMMKTMRKEEKKKEAELEGGRKEEICVNQLKDKE